MLSFDCFVVRNNQLKRRKTRAGCRNIVACGQRTGACGPIKISYTKSANGKVNTKVEAPGQVKIVK
ncbi:MAG: hypothetical protein LBV74_11665 [Tannerella sp.]|jgi:hypothetical protein|nr:hypothetical protein [Tannerella sp.]